MSVAPEAHNDTDASECLLTEDTVMPAPAMVSGSHDITSSMGTRRHSCGYKAVLLSGSMFAAVIALCRMASFRWAQPAQLSPATLIGAQEKMSVSARDWQQADLVSRNFERVVSSLGASQSEDSTEAPTPAPLAPRVGVAVVDPNKPPTLFCFSMVLIDGVEQWLMATQWHRGTGIFGCHKHELLSDGNLTLTSYTQAPVHAVALPGEKAWFAPAKLTPQGLWHNTNVFLRAWRHIAKKGEYLNYDWTVKADPDCVFMPGKLQSILYARQLDVEQPIAMLNCAQWGSIQGPLEVFSKAGSKKFFDGLDNCMDWTEWEEWGEDWFVNRCMNILSVQDHQGYETLDDSWCKVDWQGTGHNYEAEVKMNGPSCSDGKAAFHPYKTTEDMKKCLEQAMAMSP